MRHHISLWTFLKSISWRFIATVTTGIISFQVTGEIDTAIAITSWEIIIKTFIYYVHERLWETRRGKL